MKAFILVAATLLIALPLWAQDPLNAPEMEQTVSADDFSDIVKSVWDVIKKGADDYKDETISKSEFETDAEFQARLQQRHADIAAKIQAFADSKKLADRRFVVLMLAKLIRYNADTQTYTISSPTEISVPPSAEEITTECPSNQYISIVETIKRGYKFADLGLTAKPEYTWHVDEKTAREARNKAPFIFFKVWFRFDMSEAFTGTGGRLSIVPLKIVLFNKADNMTYWSDDILK
ncbi:MAG TPA: hypothetical protein VMM58_12250 [Bacteroidota bacterium]|nr:hypothetical protein [Bacteroidota bacterium]